MPVRSHPAVLTAPATAVAGGLLAAAAVSQIPHVAAPARLTIWVLWSFLLLRFILAVFSWFEDWIVVTGKRILIVAGISSRTVMASPMPELGEL